MKEIVNSIINAIVWALIIILLFLVGSGLYQHFFNKEQSTGFFGIGYAVVVSGSMEPNIHINDMILYQEQDQSSYEPGQVIVYERTQENGETILITHRLQEIDGQTLVTKGDANSVADAPITFEKVVGRVVWRLPYAGFFVNFVKKPVGIACVCGVIALILLIFFIKKLVKRHRRSVYKEFDVYNHEEIEEE